MKVIPENTFIEMDGDVIVEALYPDIQIDIFESESTGYCGYLASTVFNDDIFYQYYTVHIKKHMTDETKLIEDLGKMVKQSVVKTL